MSSTFNGSIEGRVVIPAPHSEAGGTINFNFGGFTSAQNQVHKHKPFSTVPLGKDPDFVDRPDILAWIREKSTRQGSWAALVGLGGIGKSQIAVQYCHDIRISAPQKWVFWIHGGTAARFEEGYRSIANNLELPGRENPESDTLQLVRNWLCDDANGGAWTMVLDNVDNIEVFYPKRSLGGEERSKHSDGDRPILAEFLPKSHGTILVTSRSKDAAIRLVGNSQNTKPVLAMSHNQAMELLKNKLEDTTDEVGMRSLVSNLDHVPLAISQAAAYINRGAPRTTITTYLDSFQRSDGRKTSLLNRDAGDLRRDEHVSNSVIKTWHISFDQLREERSSASDLLSLMSFFHPQRIPDFALRGYHLDKDSWNVREDDAEEVFDEDLATLQAYSLVTATARNTYEMHHLVQFCTKVWLSSFRQEEQWRGKFLLLMQQQFPVAWYENWTKCQILLPHVESLLNREPTERQERLDWAQLLSAVSWYLSAMGRGHEAEQLIRRVLRPREEILGRDHPATLESLEDLGVALMHQALYPASEQLIREVLRAREIAHGKEDSKTLRSLERLATVLFFQRKYNDSTEMRERVLQVRESAMGREHNETLIAKANLTESYSKQGRLHVAEKLAVEVLETSKRLFGPEHPVTLSAIHVLSRTYYEQCRWNEAEALYLQIPELIRKTLDPDHPETIESIYGLAITYYRQGRYKEAEALLLQVVEAFKRASDRSYPYWGRRIAWLARTMERQGDTTKAIALMEESIREMEVGSEYSPDELPDAQTTVQRWRAQVHRTEGDAEVRQADLETETEQTDLETEPKLTDTDYKCIKIGLGTVVEQPKVETVTKQTELEIQAKQTDLEMGSNQPNSERVPSHSDVQEQSSSVSRSRSPRMSRLLKRFRNV